jgi:hypothetical protein
MCGSQYEHHYSGMNEYGAFYVARTMHFTAQVKQSNIRKDPSPDTMAYSSRTGQRNAPNAHTYMAPPYMPRSQYTDEVISVAVGQPGHDPDFQPDPNARPGTHQDMENFVGVHLCNQLAPVTFEPPPFEFQQVATHIMFASFHMHPFSLLERQAELASLNFILHIYLQGLRQPIVYNMPSCSMHSMHQLSEILRMFKHITCLTMLTRHGNHMLSVSLHTLLLDSTIQSHSLVHYH